MNDNIEYTVYTLCDTFASFTYLLLVYQCDVGGQVSVVKALLSRAGDGVYAFPYTYVCSIPWLLWLLHQICARKLFGLYLCYIYTLCFSYIPCSSHGMRLERCTWRARNPASPSQNSQMIGLSRTTATVNIIIRQPKVYRWHGMHTYRYPPPFAWHHVLRLASILHG